MSKSEKNGKLNRKDGNNTSIPSRIKEIKERVQNYYLGHIDGKGELNKAEVLKHMQTEEFIEDFTQWYESSEKDTVKKLVRVVVTKFVQKDKENESKCQGFVDTISIFTNGFDFLVSDIESYKAMRGAKESKNLPSIEEYNRLLELKTKINTIMQLGHKTEAEAIRDLLRVEEFDVKLKIDEAMILRRRIDVIDGKVKAKSKKEEKVVDRMETTLNKSVQRTNISRTPKSIKPQVANTRKNSSATTTKPNTKDTTTRSLKTVQERLKKASEKADAQKHSHGTNTLGFITKSQKSASRVR